MCHGQILSEAIARARKDHTCGRCGRAIQPGKEYQRKSWVFEGEMDWVKLCLRCVAAHSVETEDEEYCIPLITTGERLKELASYHGWKKLRDMFRTTINNLRRK